MRYYLDLETNSYRVSTRKTNIALWCLKKAGESPVLGSGNKSLGNEILKINKSCTIYAHNGSGFDFGFILNYLLNQGYEIESEFQPLTKDKKIMLFLQGTKIYDFKVYLSNKKIITFRCTLLLTLTSLEKIGKVLKFPK